MSIYAIRFLMRQLHFSYADVSLWISQVLDMNAYETRQKEYALKGHKHFYFMTLNGSEVCITYSLLPYVLFKTSV